MMQLSPNLYFDVPFYVCFPYLILYLLQSFTEIESDNVLRVCASLYSDALYISTIKETSQNEN